MIFLEVSIITTYGNFTDHINHVLLFADITRLNLRSLEVKYNHRASTTFRGYGKHCSMFIAGTNGYWISNNELTIRLKDTYGNDMQRST
jgi:hypothetical protein